MGSPPGSFELKHKTSGGFLPVVIAGCVDILGFDLFLIPPSSGVILFFVQTKEKYPKENCP
jgi:hypothetical protein